MRLMDFYITLEDLPRTLLGKIKRYAVKETWLPRIIAKKRSAKEEELSDEDQAMMKSDLGKKIIACLTEQTGFTDTITPASLLELTLGIDSLGRIELAADLEKALGVEINDDTIGNAFTVRDLIRGIEPLVPQNITYQTREKGRGVTPTDWRKILEGLPRQENLDKIDLKPGPLTWLACFLFLLPILVFFKLFHRLKVEGKENIPAEGPYILYGNHTSYYDGFLAGVSLPRFPRLELFFVGFRPYFTVPIIRNLIRTGRIIPLDFSTHLLESMKSCYYVLKNGRSVCLFPEGLRTLDGKIGKFKKGFGILTAETAVKIIPFVVEGSYEAWPRTSRYPRIHPIKVKYGCPLNVSELVERGLAMGAPDKYDAVCLAAREELIKLKKT